jgi:hypothetical protein
LVVHALAVLPRAFDVAVNIMADEDVFGILRVGRAVPAELVPALILVVVRQFYIGQYYIERFGPLSEKNPE